MVGGCGGCGVVVGGWGVYRRPPGQFLKSKIVRNLSIYLSIVHYCTTAGLFNYFMEQREFIMVIMVETSI